MKRLIPTLLLVLVCIVAYWYASSHNFFREKKDEVKQLTASVKKEDVQSFSINTPNGQIELQRSDKDWKMTKPSDIPLNVSSVEGWLDSFGLVTYEAKVEDNAADLAKYGLDKPKQTFKVTMKNGSAQTLLIGDPLPIQGYYYAKMDGSNTVYQVGEQQITSLGKTQVDFMQKSPVKFDYDKVTGMQLNWKGQKWALTKTEKDKSAAEAKWKLGGKELKGSDVSPILDKFLFLETQQVAKPASQVKIDSPDLYVELTETDNGKDKTTMYQGKIDGGNVWLVKQGDAWAYAIPTQSIQELADKGKQ
jgi:hypothetical protein